MYVVPILLAGLCCLVDVTSGQEAGPLVETIYGPVRGVYLEEDGAQAFYGVPFAAPPVGDLRWEMPREPESWGPDDEWVATENPPGCPQLCQGINPPIDCPEKTSEDCLYLNIFTPIEASPTSGLPVLVFIPGGGYTVNSAASPLFDGRFLAVMTSSVVVVTNYRLGALGFMLTADMVNATKTQGSFSTYKYLGYGIEDQRQAFKFVQSNIAYFGGNPSKVTISGQSVGAECVAYHLALNESNGLFHQVIIQSAPLTAPKPSVAKAQNLARLVAEFVNCAPGDMTCLRSKPADEIVAAQNYAAGKIFQFLDDLWQYFQPWGPVLDTGDLTPIEIFDTGNFRKMPMMLGTTSEEGRWSIYSFLTSEVPNIVSLPVYLLLFGAKDAWKVYWKYPLRKYPEFRDAASFIASDYLWTCVTRRATRDIVAHEDIPIYHYVFDHAINDSAVWDFAEDWCQDSACHVEDLFFLFYTLPLEGFSYTDQEKDLAKTMIRYWANFVHTGNPNAERANDITSVFRSAQTSSILKHLETKTTKSPSNDILQRLKRGLKDEDDWPAYNPLNDWPSLRFKIPENDILYGYRSNYCNMWDNIGYDTSG